MTLLRYATFYLLIGAGFMLLLDVLHRLVRHQLHDEFKPGYQNWERIYIILTWPIFIWTITSQIIKERKQK